MASRPTHRRNDVNRVPPGRLRLRMKILRVYESWIHTHFVTDGQRLPTDRVREIERGITPTLRELGIVFGIHLEREHSDPGIRVVLECRPNQRELTLIRRR